MVKVLSLLLLLLVFFSAAPPASSATFKCGSKTSCQGMVGFINPKATTASAIKRLFGTKTHHALLGANSWPLTNPNRTVPAGATVRVPFPCRCRNATGSSAGAPVYRVKKGESLDWIATERFAGLVTYQEIAAANGVQNPALVQIGQRLWVPLPCSCDEVEGARVVHYGHVVGPGSSLAAIAAEFGASQSTLMSLNGLARPNDLKAGAVLDVPLKTCSSSVGNTSLERSFLVPNGSFALTANNCVQCSCKSDDLQLQCKPAQGVRIAKWKQCPAMQCAGNVSLGVTLTEACSLKTCAYAGYTNERILTALTNRSTCQGAPGFETFDDNLAKRVADLEWRWSSLFITLIGLFCSTFL